MKIVILDAYTVDQGELTWDGLSELAEVEAYERTSPDEVIARCKGAEMVLTNKVVLDAAVLNMLPRLQYIGVLATGYNVVDLEVASRQNIVVTNIPAYSTESVAQMVFCHLLNIVSHVDYYAIENRSGRWSQSPDFCYLDHNLFELNGKKMGIVGLGNTGMATARIAAGFGLQVFAATSKDEDDLPYGIKKLDLDTLFEQCDIVSLHCPLTDDTFHLVDADRLATMKPSSSTRAEVLLSMMLLWLKLSTMNRLRPTEPMCSPLSHLLLTIRSFLPRTVISLPTLHGQLVRHVSDSSISAQRMSVHIWMGNL